MTTPDISVTFTGADNLTLIDDVTTVADEARRLGVRVEFALLCSASSAGQERYPTGYCARHLLRVLEDEGVDVAVHLCGAVARDVFMRTHDVVADLREATGRWAGAGERWCEVVRTVVRTGRVQVNASTVTAAELVEARRALKLAATQYNVCAGGRPQVIGQLHDASDVVAWPAARDGVAWLLDASAGRGVVRGSWPALPDDQAVGLAGGISPDTAYNAAAHLLRSTRGGWLDMESGIRAGGKLNPARCVSVLRRVAQARDAA